MKQPKKVDAERVKKKTQSVMALPTLPTVVSKMIEMIDDRGASAQDLANLISTDAALTARLLKMANAPYNGFQREISTVDAAVSVLGIDTVKDMGLSLSVFDAFKDAGPAAAGFDAVKFWEHSAACGAAARNLSAKTAPEHSGEAFVAGLLHDIGKIILNQYFGNEWVEALKKSRDENCDLDKAENEVFGVSHSGVGAWLTEKWNLPHLICDAVKHHHAPWEAEADPAFAATVTVADAVCHLAQIGDSGRKSCPRYGGQLWQIFDAAGIPIKENSLKTLRDDFLAEYRGAGTNP
jgi:putative nucleotidyltransferase with HDIG domain